MSQLPRTRTILTLVLTGLRLILSSIVGLAPELGDGALLTIESCRPEFFFDLSNPFRRSWQRCSASLSILSSSSSRSCISLSSPSTPCACARSCAWSMAYVPAQNYIIFIQRWTE